MTRDEAIAKFGSIQNPSSLSAGSWIDRFVALGLLKLDGPIIDGPISVTFPNSAQLNSACLSYRHDFGLLDAEIKDKLRFDALEWLPRLADRTRRRRPQNRGEVTP